MSEPEPEQKRYCEICGTQLDYIGRFTESQGSMREYDGPKCGSRRVEEEITDTDLENTSDVKSN